MMVTTLLQIALLDMFLLIIFILLSRDLLSLRTNHCNVLFVFLGYLSSIVFCLSGFNCIIEGEIK